MRGRQRAKQRESWGRRPPGQRWKGLAWRLLWVLNWGLLCLFSGFVGIVLGTYSSIAPMVPYLRDLAEVRINEGTKILSADGEMLARVAEENREFLPLEEVPEELKQAVIAIEDTDFYYHAGINPRGILRAALVNLLSWRLEQGGSTITQQLARNAYDLPRGRSLQRKLQEFLLALEIERKYTKDEILELYLNEIYFGERAYGIKVAARTYFNKAPGDLTLAESALLAGLPRAPTYHNPFRSLEHAKARRDVVLARMAEVGYITPERAQMAKGQSVKLAARRAAGGRRTFRAPYFCAYVIQETEKMLGPEAVSRGGLTIHTTLNWDIQKKAEEALREGVRRAKGVKVNQGALVALEIRTGAIKALVGGVDYAESEFNRAVQGNRQVGSAFKPFVYTAAIDLGMKPDDYILDSPVSYPGTGGKPYTPHNYDHSFMGRITLTRALAFSRNVAAVRLIAQIGVGPVIEMAYRMGLRGPLDPYLSLALGTCSVTPLEMASSFAVLASGGYRTEPYAIAKIEDAAGKILYEHYPKSVKVLRRSTAETMSQMLAEVIRYGTASRAAQQVGGLPFFAAGKTGTTSDHKDAWFIGWGDGLACAVWVGNDRPIKMGRVTGGSVPAPIWMRFMKAALPVLSVGRERAVAHATELDRLAAAAEQPLPSPSPESASAGEGAQEPESGSAGIPGGGESLPQSAPSFPQERAPTLPPVGLEGPAALPESGATPGSETAQEDGEMVGICAVTGKRATPYCPRILLRSFSRGLAPTSSCPLHPIPIPYRER